VDAASQLAGYWYEVVPDEGGKAGPATGWRPGLFVKADLPLPGSRKRPAVAVPLTALLVYQGGPVVFVRAGPGTFRRRRVRVLGRDGNTWVLADGVGARDAVVSRGAETLLSAGILAGRPGGDEDND
jgi:multidrug efflux pump subunit AcrA (membrane-fusion protein)